MHDPQVLEPRGNISEGSNSHSSEPLETADMALPEEVWGRGPGATWGVCLQPSVLSCPGHALFSVASLWLSLHLSVLSPVFISPHLPFCHCVVSCLSPSLTSCCISLCICLMAFSFFLFSLSPSLTLLLFSVLAVSISLSLSLSLAVSSLSPTLGVDLCCGIMPSPEGRSGRPAETSADSH